MEDNAKFCPKCGTAVSTQEDPAPAQEETAEAEVTEPETPAPQEEEAAPKAETPEKSSSIGDLLMKLPKNYLVLGVCIVALILVIGLAIGIANSGDKGYMFYLSDEKIFVADGRKLKPVELCDFTEYSPASSMSKDGKKWLLSDEDGALYFAELGSRKGPVKLASDYDEAYADENFKIFTYTKDNAIYQCNAKGDAVKGEKKIQSKVGSLLTVSSDAKIIYFKDEDGAYYVKEGRKDAQLICEAEEITRILGYTENYKTIYFLDEENTLCSKTVGKDVVEIVEDVVNAYGFFRNLTDGSFYVITSDDKLGDPSDLPEDDSTSLEDIAIRGEATLHLVKGTKVTEVIEELPYTLSGFDMICAREADAAVIGYYDIDEDENVYYMVVGTKSALWDEQIEDACVITSNGSTVYYIDEYDENGLGDLYSAKVSTKPSSGKLVDEEVTKVNLFDNKPVYFKDIDENNEGTLCYNGKVVSEDVPSENSLIRYHKESGSILFYTDYNSEKARGTLCKYNGKTKTVAEDVYHAAFMTDGRICYLTEYKDNEGELYISGRKKPIADEVSYFATSYEELR